VRNLKKSLIRMGIDHLVDLSEQVGGWHDFIIEIRAIKQGLRQARFQLSDLPP